MLKIQAQFKPLIALIGLCFYVVFHFMSLNCVATLTQSMTEKSRLTCTMLPFGYKQLILTHLEGASDDVEDDAEQGIILPRKKPAIHLLKKLNFASLLGFKLLVFVAFFAGIISLLKQSLTDRLPGSLAHPPPLFRLQSLQVQEKIVLRL